MSWSWAALMPHPPILVPEVGQGREREAAVTLDGLERLDEKISGARPDLLLLLSPHQSYAMGAFFINQAQALTGSLASFGAGSIAFDLQVPQERLQKLAEHLAAKGALVRLGEAPDMTRDQGTLVPLYFLRKAWDSLDPAGLPPVVVASPIGLDTAAAFRLGEALASFEDGLNWALLASGDLSHRLIPGAPAGYSPVGKKFDEAIVEALSLADPQPLFDLSHSELEEAGECGLRSVMVLLGLCRALKAPIEVLSYEGPFGVGYANALAVFLPERQGA